MANFIKHEPCPACGSKDNLARYDDDSAYCFGCEYYEGENIVKHISTTPGEYKPLIKRKISLETCKRYNYKVGELNGKPCHIMDYGAATKYRFQDKTFSWQGNAKAAKLFGEKLFKNKDGKRIIVTEGEIDCLSISQVFGNKWEVVSIKNGAAAADKDIKTSLEFLQSYEQVVFCFDQDAVGQEAAKKCADLFTTGQARIAVLPHKTCRGPCDRDRRSNHSWRSERSHRPTTG